MLFLYLLLLLLNYYSYNPYGLLVNFFHVPP